MKLILGTVQFGLEYGITNHVGQPSAEVAFEALEVAWNAGIRVLDSAQAYGHANKVIAEFHGRQNKRFGVINKIMRHGESVEDSMKALSREREEMSIDRFDCIMFHYARSITQDVQNSFLEDLKNKRLARRVGLSIETQDDYSILGNRFDFDIIQLPLNVVSQIFMPNEFLNELKKKNIEIHVRSAFMQGLMLGDTTKIPPHLQLIKPLIQKFQNDCRQLGISPATGCFLNLLEKSQIDHIVVGAQNSAQLQEIIEAFYSAQKTLQQGSSLPWAEYACDTFDLVHPSRWPVISKN